MYRTLLYLQLIVQIQDQLSSGDSAFDILKKPDHILSFIKHALQTATQKPAENSKPPASKAQTGLKLEDLRIVDVEDDEDSDDIDEGDSNDEDEPSAPREGSDEDMTSTALNLFLAVMEGNSGFNSL